MCMYSKPTKPQYVFVEPINQFAQLHGLRRTAANGCNDVAIQIGGAEAVIGRIDWRAIARREAERIELRRQMPERAVGIDKLVGALLTDERRVVRSLRCFCDCRRIEHAGRLERRPATRQRICAVAAG